MGPGKEPLLVNAKGALLDDERFCSLQSWVEPCASAGRRLAMSGARASGKAVVVVLQDAAPATFAGHRSRLSGRVANPGPEPDR